MGSCEKLSADVISSLPDDIMDSILARLPLREAVRTSILSKEWRYKWACIPNLEFDFLVNGIPNLRNVVYQVLHNHQGPINKFFLNCRTSPDIDQWILLLSSSHVHDFKLHIYWGNKHGIAPPFFAFQNLKRLYLYRCIFKPPQEFKGFSKLATLDFQEVDYDPAIFEQLISQSPLLESVRLVSCTDLDEFEFQGPSLRIFTFHGVFKTIGFKKSPVLAEVTLSIPVVLNMGLRSSVGFKYFHIPPMLEKLHLHPCVLEILGAGGLQSRFADSFNYLKVLNLSMYLYSIEEVACAFCLARSSPNLQRLRVTLYTNRTVASVIEFIRAQETPDPYLCQLRQVEITLCFGHETEMELLRYLLASAAGLEEMIVSTQVYSFTGAVMNLLKQFPRASPTARVFVNGRGL